MFVYIRSEPSLWTVGHYAPSGEWHPESDHDGSEAAALRCHWLNGGQGSPELAESDPDADVNLVRCQACEVAPTGLCFDCEMAMARQAAQEDRETVEPGDARYYRHPGAADR